MKGGGSEQREWVNLIDTRPKLIETFRFVDEDDYEHERVPSTRFDLKVFRLSSKCTIFYHFSLEKLALLSLVKEVTRSQLPIDILFSPLRHSRENSM